jgi:hypothetical protein
MHLTQGFLRAAALACVLTLIPAAAATATVWTDQDDYTPGSVVTISGDNSNDAGYLPDETVNVSVSGPNGWTADCDATVGNAGAWSCQITLADGPEAIGEYQYTAIGATSGTTEHGTFTDAGLQIRTFATGQGYSAVVFVGDGQFGNPDSILGFPTADCTGTPDKWLPGNETTNTDGSYDVADGMSNIGSVQITAPSPITIGVDTYEFSSWSFSNGSAVGSATDNPVCIVAGNNTLTTFVTANYVLAPVDVYAPTAEIEGPCADPAYYGVFDNTNSTMTVKFRYTWWNGLGRNTFYKYVPAGAIYTMWDKWSKAYTNIKIHAKNPDTGKWELMDHEVTVKGYYPPCTVPRGFAYPTG